MPAVSSHRAARARRRARPRSAMTEEITSAANPLIKRVRLLADRKHRRREGAFVVHGVQPVWQAIDAGAAIETLIVAPNLLTLPSAVRVLASPEHGATRFPRGPGPLLARRAERDCPSGLAKIVRQPAMMLADVP